MNGLSLLIKDLFNIPPDIFIFIFSCFILLISLLTIGVFKSSSILFFTFLYPIFINITYNIDNIITFNKNLLIIYATCIGLISGIVNGICFKIGLAAGPIPLLSEIINKYTKLSFGKITLCLNSTIIIVGAYKYGVDKVFYALFSIFINSKIVDKITLVKTKKK